MIYSKYQWSLEFHINAKNIQHWHWHRTSCYSNNFIHPRVLNHLTMLDVKLHYLILRNISCLRYYFTKWLHTWYVLSTTPKQTLNDLTFKDDGCYWRSMSKLTNNLEFTLTNSCHTTYYQIYNISRHWCCS